MESFSLANPPIVEAVIDINCDLSSGFSLEQIEEDARGAFSDRYPVQDKQWVQQLTVEKLPDGEHQRFSAILNALRYSSKDGRQLVQVRRQGFSFNRLAPYESLDNYILEIESMWASYLTVAKVVKVRQVSLRFINHVRIPDDGVDTWEISDYFRLATSAVWQNTVMVANFLARYSGYRTTDGSTFQVALSPQPESGVVLDITVEKQLTVEPEDWPMILDCIMELRQFKNYLFKESVTEKCLQLYQ